MILFVDDEGRRVAPWLEALEEAFGPVRLCVDPDAALVLLEADPRPEVRLLVWDLMMPTSGAGRLTDEETEYGTRTGVAVHRRFRELYPDRPAILLTNVRDDALIARYDQPDGPDRAGRKRHLVPSKLVALAEELGVARHP